MMARWANTPIHREPGCVLSLLRTSRKLRLLPPILAALLFALLPGTVLSAPVAGCAAPATSVGSHCVCPTGLPCFGSACQEARSDGGIVMHGYRATCQDCMCSAPAADDSTSANGKVAVTWRAVEGERAEGEERKLAEMRQMAGLEEERDKEQESEDLASADVMPIAQCGTRPVIFLKYVRTQR